MTSAMLLKMQRVYQVQVDQIFDRFTCPSEIHTGFVAEMNISFERIENGSVSEDGIDHVAEWLTIWYENMLPLDIKHTEKVRPA